MSIWLQTSALIQPRTSPLKLAASRDDEKYRSEEPSGGAGLSLVKRFDIESYSDFSAKLSNFRGLVLGCINAWRPTSKNGYPQKEAPGHVSAYTTHIHTHTGSRASREEQTHPHTHLRGPEKA